MKKLTNKNRSLLLASLVIIFIILALVFFFMPAKVSSPNSQSAKEQAIRKAQQYQPSGDIACIQALTSAVHKATGAKYTFPTGCLPPGWERALNAEPSYPLSDPLQ